MAYRGCIVFAPFSRNSWSFSFTTISGKELEWNWTGTDRMMMVVVNDIMVTQEEEEDLWKTTKLYTRYKIHSPSLFFFKEKRNKVNPVWYVIFLK